MAAANNFDWDRYNVGHLLTDHPERGLSLAELEDAFNDPAAYEDEALMPAGTYFEPPRYIRVGRAVSTGRLLVLIITYPPGRIRIFSAREANRKYTLIYHEANN